MYRIGLSTNGKGFSEELFRSYHDCSITAMEISFSKKEYDAFDFERAAFLSEKYGVELWSFHLPFSPFEEIDISSPSLADSTVSYFSALMEKGSGAGIKRYIIHPSAEPIEENDRPLRIKEAKQSLYKLGQTADSLGCVLAVEDLPRTCLGRDSEEINELINVHPSLRVCLDTNHLLKESLPHFINAVGNKIITTHISDYDFIDEKHWLPGEGGICWNEVIESLKQIGYNGVWLYEVGFKAPKTIKRKRELTCKDFVQNAHCVFNGETPAKI